jgi:Uma2 family endonuclease
MKVSDYEYKDTLSWEGRWERIDGVLYKMAPTPSTELSKVFH